MKLDKYTLRVLPIHTSNNSFLSEPNPDNLYYRGQTQSYYLYVI